MKKFPDGEVKYFFLLSGDEEKMPASVEKVKEWDEKYDFGAHGITLRDSEQKGYKAFFPDGTGSDGTVIMSKGFKVFLPFTKNLSEDLVKAALEDE